MITFSGCEDKMRRPLSAHQEMGCHWEVSQLGTKPASNLTLDDVK